MAKRLYRIEYDKRIAAFAAASPSISMSTRPLSASHGSCSSSVSAAASSPTSLPQSSCPANPKSSQSNVKKLTRDVDTAIILHEERE